MVARQESCEYVLRAKLLRMSLGIWISGYREKLAGSRCVLLTLKEGKSLIQQPAEKRAFALQLESDLFRCLGLNRFLTRIFIRSTYFALFRV